MIDQLSLEFKDHYRSYLCSAAMIVGPQDAEDCVQDGFILAFRNIGQFRGGSSLRTWIQTIVRNACLSALRKRKSRPSTVPLEYAPEPVAVDLESEPADISVLVSAANLNTGEREVINRYLTHGGGITTPRDKSRKNRALDKMRWAAKRRGLIQRTGTAP
jgi:RNA polymerase sigma factor (sigma-70 family)